MKAREPDAVDGARILALTLLLIVAVSMAARELKGIPPLLLGALQHLGFLAIPLVYARVAGLRPLEASGFRRPTLRQVAFVLLAALGSLWLLKGMVDVQREILRWLGGAERAQRETEQISRSIRHAQDFGGIWAVVLLVAVPALCEETLFRGILFRGFARSLKPAAALLLTAALFAVLHWTLVQMALMFWLGLYLGVLVWLTGSVWAGILAHAVNNLAVIVSSHLFGPEFDAMRAPLWMVGLSAVVFGLALALLALERDRVRSPAP